MAQFGLKRHGRTESLKYLEPEVLSRLGNLELVARCAIEGLYAGLHPSPFHGFSVEYSDHRAYEPGDELRFIDWKMFGRSDKLYIKQFLQETNVPVYLLLDCSKSMTFNGDGPVSKLEYGSYLAAALSYLMLSQGDSVSLTVFNDRLTRRVSGRASRSHLFALLSALQQIKPEGQTRIGEALHTIAETIHRRGIVILISDLLDDPEALTEGLAHLRHQRHDVILFHTLDRQEIELDYEGLVEFQDLESNAIVRAFPAALQRAYRTRVAAFLDELEKNAGRHGMDYCLVNTSESLKKALIAYLLRRKRML